MKKTIITTAFIYIIFELLFYFAIAFSNLKINPSYWSDTAREGFAMVSIFAFIIALIFCGALGSKLNR